MDVIEIKSLVLIIYCTLSALVCSLGETFPNFKDQTPNGTFGNDVTINCTDGHGNANGTTGTLTCDKKGNWKVKAECRVQCLSDPEIGNGAVDNQITSRDVGKEYNFSCDPQFIKNGTGGRVKCNAYGEWETNQKCEDCFVRGRYFIGAVSKENVDTEALCKQKCDGFRSFCSYWIIFQGACLLFPSPIFYISKTARTVNKCIEECKNRKCVTFNLRGECYLYDQPVESILSSSYFRLGTTSNDQDVIFEKNTTCPSILDY